ncbi:LysM peptidoglycan-binding domain-containing protein, partial [Bacillus subtilis]
MATTYSTTTYTVKSGDNLGSIAQRFGMTLSEIQSLNNISNPDKIQVGQVLKVYASGNDSGSGGSTRKTTTYTVKSGDNLGSIAQRFGMTLSEIQ